MAYDEGLAQRIREYLEKHPELKKYPASEKNMFGGLAFMLRGHMLIGIVRDRLMARVGPEQYASALQEPGAHIMDFTGRPMKGFIFVDDYGYESDKNLFRWIDLCLDYNLTQSPK